MLVGHYAQNFRFQRVHSANGILQPHLPTRHFLYSCFDRMATSARVRSPIHIDPDSETRVRTGSSLPLRGTPGSALAVKVGELAQGYRRLPGRSDERHQRGTMGPLGGTSVGSALATYETLGSPAFSW